MIKADNKIVHTEDGENQTTYILQNDTHISDSFEYLPNGRIDKRVTGIGATYSELKANRHSIIVEPLRAIASFKAYKHDAIYVGSRTKHHSKPLSIKKIAETALTIAAKNEYVKIMVVADSLPKVIKALSIDNFRDEFFFIVDEIDTFQVDSGYRESLEQVMDIYFKFKNRCVVSATLREFTNPKLKNERLTILDYENKEVSDIHLTLTKSNHIDYMVAKKIEACYNEREYTLVAYNYVNGISNVIEQLPQYLQKRCKVLCSKESKSKVGNYYQEFDPSGLLAPITFITSAYFSGIDIYTQCHLISVADGNKNFTILSIDRLRQIQGRMRNGVLSNHFICSTKSMLHDYLNAEYLLKCANKTLKATGCVRQVYFGDPESGKLMNKIRTAVSKSAEIRGYRLIRYDNTEKHFTTAYFNIDALLMADKTIGLMYKNIKRLKLKIEGHYNIVEYTQVFPEGSAVETSMGIIVEKQRKLQIKGIGDALVYLAENKEVTKSVKEEASIIQRRIYNQYEKIHEFLGKKAALSALMELNVESERKGKPIKPRPYRDSRRFNNFYHALLFTALVDEHIFKRKMLETFPIGSIHTKAEILTRINSVYARADVGIIELKNLVSAMRCLKTYFKVRTLRRKKDAKKEEDKIVRHKIMKLNPYDLKLIKKLGKDIKTNAMFSGLILPDKNYSANDADCDFFGIRRIGEVEETGKE